MAEKSLIKLPRSPYLIFCSDITPIMHEENPELKELDLIKEIATLWKNLPIDEKNIYVEKAKIEKDHYNEKIL